MAEARTRSVRIRSRAAGLVAAAYVISLASFWVVGAAAYLKTMDGPSKLLGLAYFPILLLPWIGRGSIGALNHVDSPIWFWWFGLQMVLGIAAIWLWPYEHRLRPRLEPGQRALSRARSVAGVRRS
jgi:hypothetical protein